MRIRVAPKGRVERVDQRDSPRRNLVSGLVFGRGRHDLLPVRLASQKTTPSPSALPRREALRPSPRGDRAAGHRDSRGEYGCAASSPTPFRAEREAAIEPGESPLHKWL